MSGFEQFLAKHTKTFEWIGCVCAVLAALLIALNVGQMTTAYVLYLISSAGWLAVGHTKKLHGMITMQLIMTGITLLGLYRFNS